MISHGSFSKNDIQLQKMAPTVLLPRCFAEYADYLSLSLTNTHTPMVFLSNNQRHIGKLNDKCNWPQLSDSSFTAIKQHIVCSAASVARCQKYKYLCTVFSWRELTGPETSYRTRVFSLSGQISDVKQNV